MTIFNVSSAAQLNAAIAGAAGGDRIVLADGDYGRLSITNRSFDAAVTIEAANPGAGAHLDGLSIINSKNLSLVGLDVGRALNAGEPDFTPLNAIGSSSNIKLSQMTIHGSSDGDPSNDGMGLTVRNVSGFSISDSSFSDLYRGIIVQQCTNTSVQNNDITLIRSDGIISIANDGLSIQGNRIGEFHPRLGDHADAIQFWNTGQTQGQSNITIKDNVLFQSYFSGVEQTGVQGIFISDPLSYGYQNILIQNNALYSNDAYHGIFLNGATGVQILDNTVVSKSTDGKMFWIDVLNSTDVSVQNNITDRIITSNLTNYFQSGNTDFLANPSARANLPNLANPTNLHDLIAAGSGYEVPISAPASPVSGAVGGAIGDMLARAGGSAVGHTAIADAGASLHGLTSPSASPTLDLSGLKSALVGAHPVAQAPILAVHDVAPTVTFREMMAHLFVDHFVALP
jgi:hypothetical protein